MIRVKVLPPPGYGSNKLDDRNWMQLPDGSDLADVVKALHMTRYMARFFLASVNGLKVPFNTVLKDGDTVGFFIWCSGG